MFEINILHIIPSVNSGGAERMLSKIVNNQNDNKHFIITLTKNESIYNFANTKIYYVNRKSIFHVFKIVKIIINIKPHLINTWMNANIYGLMIKVLNKKTKVIFNIRHDVYDENLIRRFISKIIGVSSHFVDLCIYVSKSSFENHLRLGFNKKNAVIITNGFNVFSENLYKRNKSNIKIIGYVGRLHPVKNQRKLIEILNSINEIDDNIEFSLAGKDLDKIKEYPKKNINERIKFLGEVTNLDEFYKSIDLLLLTSIKEGFPNVIGEAMSFGVPVASTKAGDSFEIIGNTGYKIEENKPNYKSAEEIYTLLNNEYLMRNKSHEAKKRIEDNYDIEMILNDINYFYKKIGEQR